MRKIGHRVSGSVEDFVRDLIDGNEEAELLGLEVVEGEVNRSCTKLTTLANDDNDQEMAGQVVFEEGGGLHGRAAPWRCAAIFPLRLHHESRVV